MIILVEGAKRELVAATGKFTHQLDILSERVTSDVEILSLDYALRQAIAQHDYATEMSALRNHKDCAALFRRAEANSLGRDCSDIEHPLETNDWLQQTSRWTGPGDEEEIRADQRSRVSALWSCVCRDHRCNPSPSVLELDDDSYFQLLRQELATSPKREQELTCLSWSAAAVQRYKTAGMNYADALRCAFDDDSVAPARDYIAHLEVTPCY